MAKTKGNIRGHKEKKEGAMAQFSLEKILPQKYHVPAAILVIILLYLIFLNPLYFGGKTFQSGDIVAMESSKVYVEKDRDGFSLWNPYIFCGMPAYATGTEFTWFNLIYAGVTVVRDLFTGLFADDYVKWTFYLIILGISSFFFMRYITKNTLVSLFTALATAFSTGLIVFLFIGHVTKLTSLCIYPLIFLMLFRMQEKIRLIDFLLLVIALQIFVQGFHVQIIFYTLFAVGIYFLYYIIRAIAVKDKILRNNILKSAGVFIVAAAIAILIQSDSLTQIYEYTNYSTRGTEGILEKAGGQGAQSESDYYEYHTDWSFSPGEVLTFLIPSYYGFGNVKYTGPETRGQEIEINTYFGQMRFVDVAMYMGGLIFLLGLFAIFTRWKEPIVQFLTILAGISLLISFGRNFPVLYDLLFYNLPYFNKFRVPSMILVLVQLTFPVLAGLGLMKIISLRKERNQQTIKAIKILGYIFAALFFVALLFNSSLGESFGERLTGSGKLNQALQSYNQYGINLAKIAQDVFISDLLFAFGFAAIFFWIAFYYINSKISPDTLVIMAIILVLIDLWRIDSRGARYQEAQEIDNSLAPPEYVNVIKGRDDNLPFRILNLKQDGTPGSLNFNSNYHVTFLLEDFFGYSGIKPRAFQDIVDVVGPANPTLWRMLNVKYIITPQPFAFPGLNLLQNTQSGVVYENSDVLPRVYLVNRVEKKENLEFLNLVKSSSFDPKDVAFVHDKEVKVDIPDSTASVSIVNYVEDKLIADVNASGNNFLFFGSTYLPTGWKAFIDENETEIIRTNHGFMGIVVPEGKHKVEFTYAPDSFFISKNISLVLSSLVVAGLIFALFLNYKKRQTAVAE